MLADPLTKNMKPDRLLHFLKTGILDLEPTDESKMSKLMKQAQRRKAKEEKKSHDEDNNNITSEETLQESIS